jgi:hypothetical protein
MCLNNKVEERLYDVVQFFARVSKSDKHTLPWAQRGDDERWKFSRERDARPKSLKQDR